MSATPGNTSLAQVVSRRKGDRQESFLLCFHSADSGWRDRGVTRSFSLRDQFPQRGQSSVDTDVQPVFKVVARKLLLRLKE